VLERIALHSHPDAKLILNAYTIIGNSPASGGNAALSKAATSAELAGAG
jgi:hypothetical protein